MVFQTSGKPEQISSLYGGLARTIRAGRTEDPALPDIKPDMPCHRSVTKIFIWFSA
jgi:hypothetical protein